MKIKLDKTVICPVLLYDEQFWSVNKKGRTSTQSLKIKSVKKFEQYLISQQKLTPRHEMGNTHIC